jgi:dolichol-phosphate mannosyltransferase
MATRFLTALPVFNEEKYVRDVLREVRQYSPDILAVDDGSTDGTPEILRQIGGLHIVTHEKNRGYGAALNSAFAFAQQNGYDVVVTIDCDGQHEPQRIPRFVAASQGVDIVSGSRYLKRYPGDSEPPAQRRWVNQRVTAELNRRLGYNLTDAFCGFKAYRVDALKHLNIDEVGYAMPLQLWVQAAAAGLKVIEVPVPLIYLDEKRSFGGVLDDAAARMEYYHLVIDRSIAAAQAAGKHFGACAQLGELG